MPYRHDANRTGDCFEAAAHFLMENLRRLGKSDLRLVHAEVSGQGPLAGTTFAHAWVEHLGLGMAFDPSNGRLIVLPISDYRRLADIPRENVVSYTAEQAMALLLKHEHYGPWDLETGSGL